MRSRIAAKCGLSFVCVEDIFGIDGKPATLALQFTLSCIDHFHSSSTVFALLLFILVLVIHSYHSII